MWNYIIIAGIVILIGSCLSLIKRNDIRSMSLTLTGTLSFAAMILVFPYFYLSEDLPIAVIQSIRFGFSAVAMGVDGSIPYELELQGMQFQIYRFFLYALYILGPLSGSLFLITFSSRIRTLLSFIGKKHFHVFSQINEISLKIASSIHESRENEMLVFCNCENLDQDLLKQAREINALVLKEKEYRLILLKNRFYEFYEIEEDGRDRFQSAASLCENLTKQDKVQSENLMVRILLKDLNRELILNLERQYADQIPLRPIDEDQALTIEALSQCMDLLSTKKDLKAVVIGEDELSLSFIRNLLCLMIKPESGQEITLLGPSSSRLLEQLYNDNPELTCYDIKSLDCSCGKETTLLKTIKQPDIIFVLYKDSNLSYRCSDQIKCYYSSINTDLHCPEILCFVSDGILQKTIRDAQIHFFGNYEELYSYDRIVNPSLEEAASRVHLSYLRSDYPDILESDSQLQKKILKESGFYRYQNQESSFGMALALKYKKSYILSFRKDDSIPEEEFIFQWLKDEKNMQAMADAEHNRWMAFERSHGWRLADKQQTKAIIHKYEGSRANDPELRLHPALVENKDLSNVEEMVNELLKDYGSSYRVHYLNADRQIIEDMIYILGKE